MLSLNIKEFGYTNKKLLFSNLKFEISNKKTIIKGINGSGKSTLSFLLSGIIPNIHRAHFRGDLQYYHKHVTLDMIKSQFYYQFQNPSFNFLSLRVSDLFDYKEFSIQFSSFFPENSIEYDQLISELSVGQKQQLSFYKAMTSNKDVIFLDEPFAFLDSNSVNRSIQLLNEDNNKCYILINHREDINNAIELDNEISLGNNRSISSFTFNKESYIKSKQLFRITNLEIHLPIKTIEIKKELTINKGEIIGIVGDNGSGKTMISKAIAGLIKSKINIYYKNQLIKFKRQRDLIRLVFQDADYQIFHNDIKRELEIILNYHFNHDIVELKIKEFEELFRDINETDPFKLSYGQKKLYISIIIYLLEPELMILDEPFSGLDSHNLDLVNALIDRHLLKDKAIILTSHDENLLKKYSNKVIYI